MKEGNILGIDYGKVNVGLSFGNTLTSLAVPYKVLKNKNIDRLLDDLSDICTQEDIKIIVLGMPGFLKVKYTEQYLEIKAFLKLLESKIDCEIFTEDESFSTAMSEKFIKNADDSLAASVILQSFLDRIHK